MGRFTAERYESLFDIDVRPEAERGTDRLWWRRKLEHNTVELIYRTKRIICGDYLELESYPVWKWQKEATRARKARVTEEAQMNQNRKDSRKKMIRLTNTNFGEGDLFATLTYRGEQPSTAEEARRDMQAFIRRLKRRREKQGLPPLKYIYTIEYAQDGRKKRVHHHVVLSGMDRDAVEAIWEKGRANTHKLQPDEYGLEGLARYMVKGDRSKNERMFSYSRNLKQPRIFRSDQKICKRDVEYGCVDEAAIREKVERDKRNEGYVINDISIKRSEFVAGAYVHVRLRRAKPKGKHPAGSGPGRGRGGEK